MQIINTSNLLSAYSKKANKWKVYDFDFPSSTEVFKIWFYLSVKEGSYSNVAIDRPFWKRCGALQTKVLPTGALQAGPFPKQQGILFLLPSAATRALISPSTVPQSPQTCHLPQEQKAFDCKRPESLTQWIYHRNNDPLPKQCTPEKPEHSMQSDCQQKDAPNKSRSPHWGPASLNRRIQQQLKKSGKMQQSLQFIQSSLSHLQ